VLAIGAKILSVCLPALLFGIPLANAQSNAGAASTISGSVLDVSGKPIPGADISAKSESSGLQRIVVADQSGKFSISGLAAGLYTVEASAPSFAPSRRTGVILTANGTQDFSISLNVGEIAQSITVEGHDAGGWHSVQRYQ
jgi:hypothetical protein